MLRSSRLLLCGLLGVAASVPALQAQYARPKVTQGVSIDQKLNSPVPLDLVFRDEANQAVPLRTYFGEKPVVLELVYFNCTSLCPMTLMESVNSLKRVPLQPGRDYNVVVVSIDPHDTPAAAAEKKTEYAQQSGVPGFNSGWHFLTGSQTAIRQLADAVGFHFRWDDESKQFIHAGGIMIATPDGKLSRYFYGIDYAPQDLRMALVEASKHRISSPVDYVLLFCFHYDYTQGKYTFAIMNILKLGAGITIAGICFLLYLLMRKDKTPQGRVTWKEASHVR